MTHAAIAQQGHKYTYGGKPVLSMGTGPVVFVREITGDESAPLGPPMTVKASWLTEAKMRYFHDELPA